MVYSGTKVLWYVETTGKGWAQSVGIKWKIGHVEESPGLSYYERKGEFVYLCVCVSVCLTIILFKEEEKILCSNFSSSVLQLLT